MPWRWGVPWMPPSRVLCQNERSMRAMVLRSLGPVRAAAPPLELIERPEPRPGAGELLIRVSACGVCHTELDEIEGRTPPPRLPIVPGHQVVGRVEELGAGATGFAVGDRVGVAWIFSADGTCAYCRRGYENLCPHFRATGRDADGGYAEAMVVPAAFAHRLPDAFTDVQAAPLLCAGAVGFRALRLCDLQDGEPLGLTGFGASAHLVLQLARHRFPRSPVFVFARNEPERDLARQLGAAWAGDTAAPAPARCQAIIDTTPAWAPVLAALSQLEPGGRLVINAIRKEDGDRSVLGDLDYARHLWLEREIKSVANVTRADVAELLSEAAAMSLRPEIEEYALEDANVALAELKERRIRGAKVLRMG
jgi:propanol-preferring alcohol dehydrogenase